MYAQNRIIYAIKVCSMRYIKFNIDKIIFSFSRQTNHIINLIEILLEKISYNMRSLSQASNIMHNIILLYKMGNKNFETFSQSVLNFLS